MNLSDVRKTLTHSNRTTSTASMTSVESLLQNEDMLAAAPTTTGEEEAIRSSALKIRRHSQSLRSVFRKSDEGSGKSVGFDHLEVVEFPIMLGDNVPSSGGPPLALSYQESSRDRRTVDDYEQSRGPRRSTLVLQIPRSQREEILRRQGIESEEFESAAAEAERIRLLRLESAKEPQSDLKKMIAESKKKKLEKKKSKDRKGWRKLLSKR